MDKSHQSFDTKIAITENANNYDKKTNWKAYQKENNFW